MSIPFFNKKKSYGDKNKPNDDFEFVKAKIDFKYAISRNNPITDYTALKESLSGANDAKQKATILCCGDLMCEPVMSEASYFDGVYDFKPCFKFIAPVLRKSDFVIGNLETMVTEMAPYAHEKHVVDHHTGKRYHCNAPISYLDALKYAGFDCFAMANNHSADTGADGMFDTIENVDKKGFFRVGAYKDASENRSLVVRVNGINIGVLSYTEHINRHLDRELFTDTGREVMLNMYSKSKLVRDLEEARNRGAEYVICYIHFLGKEYSHEVTLGQKKLAREIAETGVDCIAGSHPHALQPCEIIQTSDGRSVPVAYSMGNFITSDNTGLMTRTNIILKVCLSKNDDKTKLESISYIPCRVVEGTLRSNFVLFPTDGRYRTRPSKLLDDAQEEIKSYVGNAIALENETTEGHTEQNGQ